MKNKLKYFLKRNSFIFKVNSFVKSEIVKYRYKKIVNSYKTKVQTYSLEELLILKGFDGNWSNKFVDRKPRIFYLGTDEFQDKSGFLQALEKFSILTYFTREDGGYGQYKNGTNVIKCNSKRLFNLFSQAEENQNTPDILLMQTSAWRIGLDTLIKLKNKYKEIKIINISMDDRHSFNLYGNPQNGVYGLLPALDLALTAAPEAVNWYLKENVPSLFFPEASSLEFFFPLNIEKKYDVGFVGANYGIRTKIVESLKNNGINVKCYGNGWENGRLPLDDTNKFFNECRIILGVGTIGFCEDFYALKLRDFDATLSGSCYITHRNKDLELLFDENEIVLCQSNDEYVTKIQFLLKNNEVLEDRAKRSYIRARDFHTYEIRFKSLFKAIKLPVNNLQE